MSEHGSRGRVGVGSVLFVALLAGVSRAAPPRELGEAAIKIEKEAARSKQAIDRARKKSDEAKAALEVIVAAEAALPEAERGKQARQKKKLEASVKSYGARAEAATKQAQPVLDAARAVEEYRRGAWAKADELATRTQAPALARELQYVAALARYRGGDHAGAIRQLDTATLRDFADAPRVLGLAHYRLRAFDRAAPELARAKLSASDAEAHAALGESYLAQKKLGPAALALAAATKAAPADARLLLLLGRTELELGHAAAAARAFERLVQSGARDRDVAYLLAAARARAGEPIEAERALERYLKKEKATVGDARYERPRAAAIVVPTYGYQAGLPVTPDEEAAQNQLAVWLAERGELEEARRRFERAPAASAARAQYNRGLVELAAGRWAAARTALDKAAAAAPERADAPHALGVVALLAGDPAAAEASFSEAQRRAPKDELPRLGLAVAKSDDAALRSLVGKGRALDTAARVNLAAQLLARRQSDAAQKILPATDAGLPEAAFVRGQLAEGAGALDDAGSAFGAAVALAPHYFDALTGLGRVGVARGDFAAARGALDRAIAIQPDEIEPHQLLARALAGLGERDAAAAESARAEALASKPRPEDKLASKPARVIGIPAFDNTGKSAAHAWLSVGIAEALATDLPKLGGLRVVDRTQLQKAFDEARLQQLTAVDATDAPKLGKMVGADALVIGSFQIVGTQVRMLGRLVAVDSGTVIRAGEASGKLDDLFAIERKLALDLLADYAGAAAKDKDAFFRSQAPPLEGLAAVAEADLALRRGDRAAAKAALARAEKSDPKLASAYADLKKTAEATANVAVLPLTNAAGRADEAWLAGGIAESLAGDLRKLGVPQVERLAIDKLMQEQRFAELFSAAPSNAAQAGQKLGAKALVVGSYACDGDRLRIDARLVDVDSQRVLLADSVEGKRSELFALETELAVRLGKQLNPTVEDKDRQALLQEHGSVAELEAKQQGGRGKAMTGGSAEVPRAVATRMAQTGVLFIPDGNRPPPPPPPRTIAVPAQLQSRIVGTGDQVRLDARLLDRRSGVVLAATSIEGPRADLARLQVQIAEVLARMVAALPPVPATPRGAR